MNIELDEVVALYFSDDALELAAGQGGICARTCLNCTLIGVCQYLLRR